MQKKCLRYKIGVCSQSDNQTDRVCRAVCQTTRQTGSCVYVLFIFNALLGMTARLDLETLSFYSTCDNICKSVYATNKLVI